MTPNEARQAVFKGQGPAGIHRIDPPHLPGEEWHAHLAPGAGSIAINRDGTWRHLPSGQKPPHLTLHVTKGSFFEVRGGAYE
jgi:hypothetical protein